MIYYNLVVIFYKTSPMYLFDFEGFDEAAAQACYEDTKQAAYRIINDLGYTCYSIGMVIRQVMHHIFQHSKVVLPLSVKLNNYYGHSDVALSVPCVLGSSGIAEVLHVPLNDKEQEALALSVKTLKSYS